MQAAFYGVGAAVPGIIAISVCKRTTKNIGRDRVIVCVIWRFKEVPEPLVVAVAAVIGLLAFPALHVQEDLHGSCNRLAYRRGSFCGRNLSSTGQCQNGLAARPCGKLLGYIELAGHPELFQLASTGSRIFVNVPTATQIAVVDPRLHA